VKCQTQVFNFPSSGFTTRLYSRDGPKGIFSELFRYTAYGLWVWDGHDSGMRHSFMAWEVKGARFTKSRKYRRPKSCTCYAF